ncbi:MAG: hypothetical protein AB7W59_17230 [Acidimicrobiia bacterium]
MSLSLALAAASVGCAWTVNIALYRLWTRVPTEAFDSYHQAHEARFVPIAVLLGIPNAIVAVIAARRAAPPLPRWPLRVAAALALVPWLVTPAYFVPLQGRIRDAGPTDALATQLVDSDLLLRAVPVTIQLGIVLWASFNLRRQPKPDRL